MIEALGAGCRDPATTRHWRQPCSYDRTLYKQRNLTERCFNRLKQFRRFSLPATAETSKPSELAQLWACAWLRLQAICGYRLGGIHI